MARLLIQGTMMDVVPTLASPSAPASPLFCGCIYLLHASLPHTPRHATGVNLLLVLANKLHSHVVAQHTSSSPMQPLLVSTTAAFPCHTLQTSPENTADCQQLVNTLVRAFDDLQQTTAALDRLHMVADFIRRPPAELEFAQQNWAHHQSDPAGAAAKAAAMGRAPVTSLAALCSVAYNAAPRGLCDRLEGSFVDQAELVFTTLSSSARDVFAKLKRPFELVRVGGWGVLWAGAAGCCGF